MITTLANPLARINLKGQRPPGPPWRPRRQVEEPASCEAAPPFRVLCERVGRTGLTTRPPCQTTVSFRPPPERQPRQAEEPAFHCELEATIMSGALPSVPAFRQGVTTAWCPTQPPQAVSLYFHHRGCPTISRPLRKGGNHRLDHPTTCQPAVSFRPPPERQPRQAEEPAFHCELEATIMWGHSRLSAYFPHLFSFMSS
jgi:hypothetical protein